MSYHVCSNQSDGQFFISWEETVDLHPEKGNEYTVALLHVHT